MLLNNKNPVFFQKEEERLNQQSTTEESLTADSEQRSPNKKVHEDDILIRKRTWGKGISTYLLREGKVELREELDEEKRMADLEKQKILQFQEEAKRQAEMAVF